MVGTDEQPLFQPAESINIRVTTDSQELTRGVVAHIQCQIRLTQVHRPSNVSERAGVDSIVGAPIHSIAGYIGVLDTGTVLDPVLPSRCRKSMFSSSTVSSSSYTSIDCCSINRLLLCAQRHGTGLFSPVNIHTDPLYPLPPSHSLASHCNSIIQLEIVQHFETRSTRQISLCRANHPPWLVHHLGHSLDAARGRHRSQTS